MISRKKPRRELNAELSQNSKYATAARIQEDAVRTKLANIKEKLAVSLVKCSNSRCNRNEMMPRFDQAEVNLNERIKAVSTISVVMDAQISLTVQRKMKNAFREITANF